MVLARSLLVDREEQGTGCVKVRGAGIPASPGQSRQRGSSLLTDWLVCVIVSWDFPKIKAPLFPNPSNLQLDEGLDRDIRKEAESSCL